MIAWGITYLAHSTLLIAAVWLASRFIRSASTRETLWKLALIAPLLTATLQRTVPMPHATPAQITLPALSGAAAASAADTSAETGRRPERAPLHRIPTPNVPTLWAIGAGLMLLRLLGGRALFVRALRDRVDVLREHDRLARLRAAMACRPVVRLTESSAVGSPIAMSLSISGWEIVVPRATFARLSEEQKETILAHEIAHLVRRDPLWLVAAELMKALLFIQPLNWIVQKKMKECAEFLCDDLAVLHTSNPRALAETLAELATHMMPMPRAVAAMAEGGSNLMARVARVLEAQRERPLRMAVRVAIGVVAVAAVAVFAPGVTSAIAAAKTVEAGTMHLSDGVLSRSFDGPEGATHVQLTAKDVDIAEDASWLRFTSSQGFLRVTHTAASGPTREIEATPARDLQPVIHYRVGGVEKGWCEEARTIVLSAFRAEKAYRKAAAEAIRVTPRQHTAAPDRTLRKWDANVHYTGSRDGVPTELRVRANDVRYDENSGEVFFEDGAKLYVEETVGNETRTFKRDARNLVWSGPFGGIEVSSWLENILVQQTKMPRKIAVEMGRE
jgi:beta-lactamase regulating signal transducer with metallopeptidase domain